MISVDDFLKDHPESSEYIRDMASRALRSGFIPWRKSEAHRWGGPWAEGTVMATIRDCRIKYPGPLLTLVQYREKSQKYHENTIHHFPYRFHDKFDMIVYVHETKCQRSELTEEEKNILLDLMTDKELAERQKKIDQGMKNYDYESVGDPSIERPFKVRLCGNDDCSYSLCFDTKANASAALDSIIRNPTFKHMASLGFVFTN